ncbi:putative ribonuclease H protein [Vitis vinifera]|uniref:Putative ribonuclease H protein n=1 Tax=Vitis vinifera TaxID=29760 RepID=A0A438E1I6_VITVI|nr:putative ribonuclease H protein [Vitis vinifera]
MRRFSEVIDDLDLRDLPLQGGPFTWSGGLNSQAMSKLDRFLVLEDWEGHFNGVVQCTLPRPVFDHFPILLDGEEVGVNKHLALDKVAFWDAQEKLRPLSMEELEARKEAKGDFEKWSLMEEEIKRGVVGAFKDLLTDPAYWHPSMEGLDFNRIDVEGIARLEEVFSDEEVFSTLSDLNRDKEPEFNLLGPNPKKIRSRGPRDFRPISLMGGLYKLLAKVLANRLKKVVGKVVSSAQNAIVEGRQILNATLIANEAIDSLLKRNESGVLCKLDLEKSKWKKWRWALVSHWLFADDTLVFCEASEDQMVYLSWLSMWFEAISGFRINLDKSEILQVGRVENLEALALEVGCKVGRLPSSYLGIPSGANHKSMAVWDGVEERLRKRLAMWKRQFISKGGRITLICSTLSSMPIYLMSLLRMPRVASLRLEKIQRDFLWGGGALERKPHLINWDTVCLDKRKGGLRVRRLSTLNRALLCKWNWCFANERENLWRHVISRKKGRKKGVGILEKLGRVLE